MTIQTADWFATSDPFKQVDVVCNGTTTYDTLNERVGTFLKGAINAVFDDPDVQEVYLRETTDPWRRIKLDAFQMQDTESYALATEFAADVRVGGNGAYEVHVFPLAADGTSEGYDDSFYVWGRFKNSSTSGSDTFGLAVETAIHWPKADPAQIIMSMLHHYLPDTYGGNGLRDFMDQASFTAASADFYAMRTLGTERTGYNMTVIRDVGTTIKKQVEDIIKQTPDWLAVRPTDDDGKAELHYIRRELATERTTAINFDEGSGVSEWRGGVDDNLTIHEIEYQYGPWVTAIDSSSLASFAINADTYRPRWNSPPDLQHEGYKKSHIRRLDHDVTKIDLPDVLYGYEIDRFWQIYWWGEGQEDIGFTQGPLHFNYEVGDLVHIECKGLGLDGSEFFLVYEKKVDLDTLEAKVRVMRVYGFRGINPARMFSPNDYTRWWYRCETFARQPDGELAHYPTATWQPRNPRDEVWLDGSGWKSNAALKSTGSTGSGYVLNSEDSTLNGWPVLENVNGFVLSYDAGAVTYCKELFVVIRHKTGTFSAAEYLFYASNGADDPLAIVLHDATYNSSRVYAGGSNDGATQLCDDTEWHIYSIQVEGTNAVATFWEETTVLEYLTIGTGSKTNTTVALLSADGDALPANVYIAEAFWIQNQSSEMLLTTQERLDIVEYLREKYGLG